MAYVDGFVMVVPKKNVAAYKKIARGAGKVWREFGALDYVECVGDDLATKFGRPFPKLAKAGPKDTVVFSWIVYASKGARDRINKKVMKDPRIEKMMKDGMPFDPKKMSMGGFKVLVQG
jgi:uncharacterized protein YbaA (DUF1428 family)